jgi:hypothetical protein
VYVEKALTIRQPFFAQDNGEAPDKEGTVIPIVADFYVADSWRLTFHFQALAAGRW